MQKLFLLLTVIISMFISGIAFASPSTMAPPQWQLLDRNPSGGMEWYIATNCRPADLTSDLVCLLVKTEDKNKDEVENLTIIVDPFKRTYKVTYVTIWQHGKIYDFYKTNEYDKPVIADVVLKYIQTLYKPTNSGQIDDDAAADAAADAAYRKVSFGGTPSQVNESLLGRELLIKGIVDEFQEMQSDNQVHILGIMCEEGNRNAYVRFEIDGTKKGTLIKWARDYVKRGYETKQLMFIKGTLKPLNGQFYIDVTEAGFIR